MMKKVDIVDVINFTYKSKNAIKEIAYKYQRPVKIYLHWTNEGYGIKNEDFHINIDANGDIYVSTNDFSEKKNHTYMRSAGSIGIALCCCNYSSSMNGFGNCSPTPEQIDMLSQIVAIITTAYDIPIEKHYVATYSEVADGICDTEGYATGLFGPLKGNNEVWDLLSVEPEYPAIAIRSYDDPHNGGNVIRQKAKEYQVAFL